MTTWQLPQKLLGNELLTLLLAERAKLVPAYKDWLYFLLATGYATGQDVANILTIFKTAEEAFSGRQWPGISMRRAHLPQAIFDHTDLSGGDLRDSLVRTNFSDARIDGVIFGEYPALKEHKGEVTKVVYAPDDRQIASASSDHTIRLWSPGKTIRPTEVFGGDASLSCEGADCREIEELDEDEKKKQQLPQVLQYNETEQS